MNFSRETVPDVPTFIHLLLSNKGCACMHEHNKQTNVVRAMASPVNYEFVDKVPEDHHCTICTNILTDPVLTECCGQDFCDGYLKIWLKRQKTCS